MRCECDVDSAHHNKGQCRNETDRRFTRTRDNGVVVAIYLCSECHLTRDREIFNEPGVIDKPGPRTEWKASLREKYGENDDI